MSILAGRIARIHKLSGLDRKEMSELARLTQCHVGMLIRGDVKAPEPDTLIKIARTFGVSLEWLLTGDGEAPSEQSIQAAIETTRTRCPTLEIKPANTNEPRPARKPRRTRVAA
jgi:transcriptional regulator with XRE-family HTH domain